MRPLQSAALPRIGVVVRFLTPAGVQVESMVRSLELLVVLPTQRSHSPTLCKPV